MIFIFNINNPIYKSQIKTLVIEKFPTAKIQQIENFKLNANYSNGEKTYVFLDDENFHHFSVNNQLGHLNKKSTSFIMVSESTQFAIGCIRHSFYDYLLTNNLRVDFELFSGRLMDDLMLESASDKNHIIIKDHKSITKLQYKNIVFIEAYGSYSNLYTQNKFYTISKTIKSIIQNFPETFVRVHRSYAINLDHVKSFSTEEVIMNNETRIKISRAKKMALLEAIQQTA